jgi:hypothetical protein
MRVRAAVLAGVLGALAATAGTAQELRPGASYDPAIPTVKQVLGYESGDEITPPDGIVRYLSALAAAAPDRCRLVEYARTWEGRPLVLFVIASPERLARLDQVKAGLRALADPRRLEAGEAERLVRELPVVVWLAHAVHGNEISSSDAALAEAYHLLAAKGDAAADAARAGAVVLIDPLQNPDGRARFVSQNLLGRAASPDPEPLAAEHDEPWPGGRSNHYLFDMNRDWLAQSQPETRGRLAIALEWHPQVVVDLHEMGGDSTYYFAPPADPLNPYFTKTQVAWLETFGRANAGAFDSRGFPYFTREVYDSFYPGYTESWPILQGAVGMTYEKASARGLVFRREDGSLLTFRLGVVQHFTAALTTIQTASTNRERLLRDFLEYRRSAVADGERVGPREYVLVPGADRSKAERLAANLALQGIEVRVTAEPVTVGTRTVPAGAFAVTAAQPSGRLVRNLLEPHVPQSEAFVKEQDRRRRRRLSDQIYDVTAWSLPLLYDVETLMLDRPLATRVTPYRGPGARPAWQTAKVAYLLPWGFDTAALVSQALRQGVTVRQSSEPFRIGTREFAAGTAIVRVAENDAAALERLAALASASPSVDVVPLDSAWVDEGESLGSGEVVALEAPRVLLAWDAPTSSLSAGWARYVLERRFNVQTTAVRVSSLSRVDLTRFTVIVLPAGSYSPAIDDGMLNRLRDWARAGGTLITLGEASRWAAREKVALLDTRTELRDGRPETDGGEGDKSKKDGEPPKPFDLEKAVQPERERPENTPGAVLRVQLDSEHWLASGAGDEVQAIVDGQRVFTPIKLDKGRNVGLYAPTDRLVASGLVWDEARDQLARKAFLIEQPMGRGHIVAFAEDPNYRALTEASELLFANAVLLGPAH